MRADLMGGTIIDTQGARPAPDIDAEGLPREGLLEDALAQVAGKEKGIGSPVSQCRRNRIIEPLGGDAIAEQFVVVPLSKIMPEQDCCSVSAPHHSTAGALDSRHGDSPGRSGPSSCIPRQHRGDRKRDRDPGDAGDPAEVVEQLAEYGAADKTTEEIAR
jgi:hypothetical protein